MFDVIIIGAGIMGATTAYELAKYNLKVLVLEKENDVTNGTTKANSAIIHAGYDAKEGSLMAKYNVAGSEMYEDLCREVGAPYRRSGSYVLAFSEAEREHLEKLYKRGLTNGVRELKIMERDEILSREPNLNPEVVAGLWAGTAAVIGPFETCIKIFENAVLNGVELKLNSKVVNIEKLDNYFRVHLEDGSHYDTKTIVNASGVYADKINNMVSQDTFKIIPRKGEYFLLDKVQGDLTNSVIFQCPNKMGKGVLVAQTYDKNLIVGPTALDIEDKDDVSCTVMGMDAIKEASVKSIKDINFRDNIRNFSGLRAESDRGDFIIGEAKDVKGFFNIAGTKSPGLSSAPAIGLDIAEMVASYLHTTKKDKILKNRPHINFMELDANEKAEVIKKDARYGRIICRCEGITEGEIVDVIHRNVGATTVDGIKKRCRPGAGRCQGGFCGPRVQEIIARELGKNLDEIVQDKKGSYILTGETKR